MKESHRFLRCVLALTLLSLCHCASQDRAGDPDGGRAAPAPTKEAVIKQFFQVQKLIAEAEQHQLEKRDVPSKRFDVLFPMAKLKLDQAMLHLDDDRTYPTSGMKKALSEMSGGHSGFGVASSGTASAAKSLREAQAFLQLVEKGRDPFKGATGLVERAYIAANDKSAQPYYLYVPKQYDGEKKWPLFIFLHGWVPNTSKIDPWLCPSEVLPIADEMGFLFLQPHGRRNTDFQFVGEIDVLDSIRETCRFYSVDEDRVYLMGASMGGAGVWHLAVHHPHVFAAVCPVNGQIDWFAFWRDLFRYPSRTVLPRYQQWAIALNNPSDLVGSLRALPTFMQHATGDHINKVQYARQLYQRMQDLECPVEAFFDPDSAGHFIYWRPPMYRRGFEKLIKYRRNRSPRVVQHHTYSLRFPRAHWATILGFEEWGKIAEIRAEVEEATIKVTTRNVSAWRLDIPAGLVKDGADVNVTLNGEKAFTGKLPEDRVLRGGTLLPGLVKSTTVCGAIADAFNFPFMVVKGTTGTSTQDEQIAARADGFLTDWWAYAEGLPPCKADTDVTDKDLEVLNLVLFGRPKTNAILARIAEKLPITIGDDHYQIGDRKFSGENVGFAMVYPNPLNPKKYVVIFSGYPWGEKRGSNHKYDLLPDFIVFTNEFDPSVDTNRALCAGFFDTQWQLSEKLTWPDK